MEFFQMVQDCMKDIIDDSNQMIMKHKQELVKNFSSFVEQKLKCDYNNILKNLSKYESKISSLNRELKLLKKENALLHQQKSQELNLECDYDNILKNFLIYESKISSLKTDLELLKKENVLLHQQKPQELNLKVNYNNILNNLSLYESKLSTLNTDLELVKKENAFLRQQLELNQDNLLTHKEILSIKEDTYELRTLISIIKEEVHDIRKSLLPSQIKGFQRDIKVEDTHKNYITFLMELKDTRIATCSYDNSISVVSLDYETKKWKQDIKMENAHKDYIYSICELSKNRLASCSFDTTLKIWGISLNKLNLLSTLTNHTSYVRKVIPITHNRLASCSHDKTVKIWSSEYPCYEEIVSLQHDNDVLDLLKIRRKNVLISSTKQISIDFWDSNTFQKLHSIKGHYTHCYGNKMIELPNELIAISSCAVGSPILIIDPSSYLIIKEIKEQEYISHYSSLCVLDTHSFVYVYEGKVVQIAINNGFDILYKTIIKRKQLNGIYGLISVKKGKYLIAVDRIGTGLRIFKPYY